MRSAQPKMLLAENARKKIISVACVIPSQYRMSLKVMLWTVSISVNSPDSKCWTMQISVNDVDLHFKLDTGAEVIITAISEKA